MRGLGEGRRRVQVEMEKGEFVIADGGAFTKAPRGGVERHFGQTHQLSAGRLAQPELDYHNSICITSPLVFITSK